MVPVLWPIAKALGIDVIHFGMIVSISNVIGTMTPPVAVNIFSAASVTKFSAEFNVTSKSFVKRRDQPSQAKERSTIQRFGIICQEPDIFSEISEISLCKLFGWSKGDIYLRNH